MDIKGTDHIYEIKPQGWFNDDETITLKLKCVPKKDFDVQAEAETTYGMEERRKKGREFVGKYVAAIEGLKVDGKEVTTFEQLYETGPADLYNWIYAACLSQEMLTKAETKN
jgi:hypothetical protein